jgi:hypothetical protein
VVATVCGAALPSLSPKPGRSHAQTLVVLATSAWTEDQAQPAKSPIPAVRMTVGLPSPMHTKLSIRPSGNRIASRVLA